MRFRMSSLQLSIISLLLLSSYGSLWSQATSCATTVDLSLVKKSASMRVARQFDTQDNDGFSPLNRLALTIHIVRNSDGTGGISEEYLAEEIESINELYLESGLNFYIDKLEYVNNTQLYEFNLTEEDQLADSRDVPNTINIYYVGQIQFLFGTACGYAYLPNQGPDRVIMSQACGLFGNTLAHEIGHFFNLIHTHGTSNSYNSTDEFVDGSNCAISGDLICDTPADPVLTNQVNNSCEYVGSFLDANDQPYNPDTRNVLSYSRGSCRDSFTNGQIERMQYAYTELRSYLKTYPVQANLISDQRRICQNESVEFTDLSIGANSWNWTFQGGNPSTSNDQNPMVVYNQPGTFSVSLQVNGENGADQLEFNDYIIVRPNPLQNSAIIEDFEEYSDISQIETETTGLYSFDLTDVYSSSGQKSIWMNSFAPLPQSENRSVFYTLPISGSLNSQYILQFDYAYKMRSGFTDRLVVSIENYCERNLTEIYTQSSEYLSGNSTLGQEFFPAADDWRQEGIFFNIIDNNEVFDLAFESISQGGNNLFIDNIRIRPVNALDQDSLVLVQIYQALDGGLPWDMTENVQDWAGVTLSEESTVTRLDFSNLQINKELPVELLQLADLDTLILDNNSFKNLSILTQARSLSVLSIASNNLVELPNDWSSMIELKRIDLRNNQLNSLPSSLLNHPGIEHINARNNLLVFDTPEQLSSSLKYLDLSGNDLNENPSLVTLGLETLINLSQNNIEFPSIIGSFESTHLYSPQNLIGATTYYSASESLELSCAVSNGSFSTSIDWYRNNELVLENSNVLVVSDLSEAYYQCKAEDTSVPGLELLGRPMLVNTSKSICEQNLSGIYYASTTYTDHSSATSQLDSEIIFTAVGNQSYEISDLSFGVENQLYNGSDPNRTLNFDCGQLFTPILESYSYYITSTQVDVITGTLIINWIDHRGGEGVSYLTLTEPGLSNETDILDFSFVSQSAPEIIDSFNKTVILRVGCKHFSSIPMFELSEGALAYVSGELQEAGSSSQDFTTPVTYTVVAEDGATSSEWKVTLLEDPSEVDVIFTIVDQTFCSPTNGAIIINDITVDGFSRIEDLEDFEITWSDDPSFENVVGDGLSIEILNSGNYYLRVAEISSGCGIQMDNIIVKNLTPNADLSIEATDVDRSCGGINTGSITSIIDGLPANYIIEWDFYEIDTWISLDEFDGLPNIDGLKSGLYRQIITDQVSNCTFSQQVIVQSQPSIIEADLIISPESDCDSPNGSINIENIIQDGNVVANPNSDFSFQWFDRPDLEDIIGTSISLDHLSAGNYYLEIVENNLLCTSQTYSIYVPANTLTKDLVVSSKQDNTLCSSVERNGAISVTVDGNTDDYTFEWFSGTNLSIAPFKTGSSISQMSGGTYTVKVTSNAGNDLGCYSTLTTSIKDNIDELNLILKSKPTTNCKSPNGEVEVEEFTVDGQITSISGVYEIEWSTNRFFGSVLSDNKSISNLSDMEYFARVTNTFTGCKTSTVSVTVNSEYPEIKPTFQVDDNTHCNGPFTGAIQLSGLEPPSDFEVSWYNNSPDIQETPIANGIELANLRSGVYYTVVQDLKSGCTAQFQHLIKDQLLSPELEVEILDQTNCETPNGHIKIIEIKEGEKTYLIDDYQVEWSATEDFDILLSSGIEASGLMSGNYYLRVSNIITGCESIVYNYVVGNSTSSPMINLSEMLKERPLLEELGALTVQVDSDDEYTLKWYSSDSIGGIPLSAEPTLSDLAAGLYTVIVETESQCSTFAEFEVVLDDRLLQEIELDIPDEVYADINVIFLSGASTSGSTVSFEVESGPGRISLGRLIVNEPGEIVLTANVTGNEQYFSATRTVTIKIKPLIKLTGSINGSSTGTVKLYNSDWEIVDQVNFSQNEYTIDDLKPGQYYLEAVPSGLDGFPRKFYPNTYDWNNAELLDLSSDLIIDLNLDTLLELEEGSLLDGVIIEGSGSTFFTLGNIMENGEAIGNVKILLVEANSNVITSSAKSDFNGQLSFGPIPSGNYFLHIDEIGNPVDLSSVLFSLDGLSNEQFTLELGDNGQVEVVVVSGIEDWISGEVILFPNPATNELNIVLESGLPYAVELRVFNLAGAMMVSETIAPGLPNFQLSLNSLQSGTYLVQLSDPRGSTTKKIIKR